MVEAGIQNTYWTSQNLCPPLICIATKREGLVTPTQGSITVAEHMVTTSVHWLMITLVD